MSRRRVLVAMYYKVTGKWPEDGEIIHDGGGFPAVGNDPRKLIFRRSAQKQARALRSYGCTDIRIVRVKVYRRR
jgi:hypothetical protein